MATLASARIQSETLNSLSRYLWNPFVSPHWKDLPMSRLKGLLIAVFFNASAIGVLLELVPLGFYRRPLGFLFGGLVAGVFVGTASVLFLLQKMNRFPKQAAVPVQLVLTILPLYWYIRSLARIRIAGHLFAPGAPLANKLYGLEMAADLCTLSITMVVGYQLFLHFVNSEGAEYVRVETELVAAHRIQDTLVPTLSLSSERLEVFGRTLPSEKVGGDLVDLVRVGGGTLAYVADVSGHGLQAGILMGMVKATCRMAFATHRPPAAFGSVNRVLPALKEQSMYATLASLYVPDDGNAPVEVSLAGHVPVLHFQRATGAVRELAVVNLPIGLLPSEDFTAIDVAAAPGDVFLITTDGLCETANGRGEELGFSPIAEILKRSAGQPLEAIYAAIMQRVEEFGQQEDDRTLLLVRLR